MVDCTPTQCEDESCKYAASYGSQVERYRRFCARHKVDGMQNFKNWVCCAVGKKGVCFQKQKSIVTGSGSVTMNSFLDGGGRLLITSGISEVEVEHFLASSIPTYLAVVTSSRATL